MGDVIRLFPVEGRTTLERSNTARLMHRAQGSLFGMDVEPVAEACCPVCAGVHAEHECPHGSAPSIIFEVTR